MGKIKTSQGGGIAGFPLPCQTNPPWRRALIGQVALIRAGWGLAQYPNLITPEVSVNPAHAPEITLRLRVLALATGVIILRPSRFFMFRIFKGKESG